MSRDGTGEAMASVPPGTSPRRRAARSRSGGLERYLPWGAVLAGVVLGAIPIVAVVLQSLFDADTGGVSPGSYGKLLSNFRFLEATANTVLCGLCVALFSVVLGTILAWIVCRTDLPGRSWFEPLNLIPFFLSPYVGALSWTYLAAPYSGLIQTSLHAWFGWNVTLPDIFGRGGVIALLTLFYTPYVYLFVIAPLRNLDGALEDAARVHGASFLWTVRHIVLPLLMPSLMSAALIVFVTSAGLFDVALALASPSNVRMLPTEIYAFLQYPTDYGQAAAASVLILAVTVILTLLQRFYLDRRQFFTVTGKGYRPRLLALTPPAKTACYAVQLIYLATAVLLPILALALVSFSAIWTGQFRLAAATWRNYHFVLFESQLARGAIVNSLYLAVVGATISVALSALQAYFLQRGPARFRTVLDILLSLSLGIPGIVLGLGLLIVGIRTPLYGTLNLILLAYVIRFFPYSTRSLTAVLLSISPELEQSARTSGAGWLATLRHIVLPLMWPGLLSAWIMVFVILIRELGATVLIYGPGTETISVALIVLGGRNTGYVAALGLIQVAILLLAFLLLKLLNSRALWRGKEVPA